VKRNGKIALIKAEWGKQATGGVSVISTFDALTIKYKNGQRRVVSALWIQHLPIA